MQSVSRALEPLCPRFERQEGVLSMKCKYSGAVVSSLCMSARTDVHFHPECKRSQQDLQLTETNILSLFDILGL